MRFPLPPIPAAAVLLTSFFVAAGAASGRAGDPRLETHAFLAAAFGLGAADLDRIDRGRVVARTLAARDGREIATLGAVRIAIPSDFYVERLADITTFKNDETVLEIGTFGSPPVLADVRDLTLDEGDIRSLRECRVGDCGVQLPAPAIDRFRSEVDWNGDDAVERANVLMREILVDYVAEYQRCGAAASMEYADRREPVDTDREFRALAAAAPGGWGAFPQLRQQLDDYPATDPRTGVDLVYWSKEKIGRRGVVTITHLAMSRVGRGSPVDYVVASKQIYGTHYFDASLGLTVLLRGGSSPSPATYVAYLNRSRVDVFDGLLGGVARRIVRSKARTTVFEKLGRIQQSLEGEFRGPQPQRRQTADLFR